MQLLIDGVLVRLAFRIMFTAIFLYLGLLGSQCYTLAKKRRLLRNGRLSLSEATGWLGLGDVVSGIWNLRRFPDRSWLLLMVLIGGLSKLSDFATSAVYQKYLPSTCPFGIGMVLATDGQLLTSIPAGNGRPMLVAGNAQLTSIANGCNQGIYRKLNDDPNFCANEHDTLGAWQCSPVGNDLTYAYGHWTNITILDDLVSRDLLYGLGFSYASFNTENKYTFGHLVGWSSSSFDGSGAVFNVKASVDTTAGNSDNKVMHSMYCTMNATGAEAINAAISSGTALGAWTMFFQGYMYNGFDTPIVTNPEETLAWYLNSMIMVGGSSDYLLSPAPLNDPDQGCVVFTTIVPTWFLALFFVTLFACLVMTFSLVVMWIVVRHRKDRALVESAPLSVWTWMAQAVAESRAATDGHISKVMPREAARMSLGIERSYGVRIGTGGGELESLTRETLTPK